MKRKVFLFALACLAGFAARAQVSPPKPFGATPTAAQLEWQKMEYYMFVHFGPNTFTDVEWGDGTEDPRVFNPTALDCRQWAATARAAGMKAIILTAKHHDGFCLWPSKYSTHTVRESAWRDGKGDLLRELSDACREYGLKLGVYLSPWDRNHPAYGTPEYNEVFAKMLDETLGGYGTVFEQWFDGANGEGPNGKAQVYDWPLFHKTVYANNPNAVIFSDIGPGCRWMGNEQGVASETNWSTLDVAGYSPGAGAPPTRVLGTGVQGGEAWVPAETDVSIRPGWFYSPATDDRVKTTDKLMDIYYTSVGRNSNLLLNVGPDRTGRIHPADSLRLVEFRRAREEAFADNLAKRATVTASHTRGGKARGAARYAAGNMLDGDFDTYWATDDGTLTPYIEVDLGAARSFNRLVLGEYIALGQRVASFAVTRWDDAKAAWVPLAEATTIGYKRILRFPAVTAQKIRVEFTALAAPAISTLEIYDSPELLAVPTIARDGVGVVTISTDVPVATIHYTTDGTEPTARSPRYTAPFAMPRDGVVKAVSVADDARRSEVASAEFDIAPVGWRVLAPAAESAARAIDGDARTVADASIAEPLTVDLGGRYVLKGFTYTPAARVQAANVYRYDFWTSADGREWTKVVAGGVFSNIANSPVAQRVMFDRAIAARYVRFAPTEIVGGATNCLVAELGVVTRSDRAYSAGLDITPLPLEMVRGEGAFTLDRKTAFVAATPNVARVAAYFAAKIKTSTGLALKTGKKRPAANYIALAIAPDVDANDEGYALKVTPAGIDIKAKTPQGLFYGMQTVMQLLPPEIESPARVESERVRWEVPAVTILDEPRFGYRGMHLDVCRHFVGVDFIKKQLDLLSMFKINTFHWHLTEDQGWRIEIKKYPRLTEVGAVRTEGEGTTYGPFFYTQDEVREVVAYARERFIEVIPEIELPGHGVAALAAYPELGCRGDRLEVRNIWGVANDVYCAGNEEVFTFLENVIEEVIPLFESDYFHIGGDECPKGRWAECPKCQARIRELGITASDGHTAEEKLQSWFVQRIGKFLEARGKKMIGWDEILEGGLAPSATVMSWRGEQGGIASANMGHDVVMTPAGWMYFDGYQGDSKLLPVTIGGYYRTLRTVYGYEPIPDAIAPDKRHHILGAQSNVWTEYKYDGAGMEHDIWPRIIATAELTWTPRENKNYDDFERRVENQRRRLHLRDVNQYIPMPEDAGHPSLDHVAFTGSTVMEFKTTEPVRMIYTTDGTAPAPATAREYTAPLTFTESATLRIRSVTASGICGPVRTIVLEKQTLAPAAADAVPAGVKAEYFMGNRRAVAELAGLTPDETETVASPQRGGHNVGGAREIYPDDYCSSVFTGYIDVPEDGVYTFSTDCEMWLDGAEFISNERDNPGTARRFSRSDRSVALAKGLHPFRLVRMGAIFGGYPAQWSWATIDVRREGETDFTMMGDEWYR